jgi:hypothetical protein
MNPLSGVLGEAWRLYRAHAAHLLTIALAVYVAATIVTALLALDSTFTGSWLGFVVQLLAIFLVQAAVVPVVQADRDGRAVPSFGETTSATATYLLALAAVSVLAGIAVPIGFILLIVPGLYLITIWAVVVPVIVIERSGALASFGRSRQIVRGNGANAFGLLFLLFLIFGVIFAVVETSLAALPALVRSSLSTVIPGTLGAPMLALVVTLMYHRLADAHPGGQYPPAGGVPGR